MFLVGAQAHDRVQAGAPAGCCSTCPNQPPGHSRIAGHGQTITAGTVLTDTRTRQSPRNY